MNALRTEHDSLGALEVPADAYWGIHTARALDNFQASGIPLAAHPALVRSLALVKQAAALANQEIGLLDPEIAQAIAAACRSIVGGQHHHEFRVDVIQGGAGTSTNMNANEVIANLALEQLGLERGRYDVISPLSHVNCCQSTNDAYPTALRLAISEALEGLLTELGPLVDAFQGKGAEFAHVVKVGRTQLQDAVPMTLGQEFTAFAVTLTEDMARLRETLPLLHETSLGATAIGTGITAGPGYAEAAVRHLSTLTGLALKPAADLVEATSDTGAFLLVSGVLKRLAVKLSKICNDLRLLSSGPQSGLAEIALPPRQAGSSIMPGKVNPVIPEMVNQICYGVAGADVSITMAAENGQLQLNAFEPLIGHLLLTSIQQLARGCTTLRTHCIIGITANEDHLARQAARSVGSVTALTPFIGYAAAARIAKEALATGTDVVDLVVRDGLMDQERAMTLLSSASNPVLIRRG
ncbi:aspartate ammonia-lyase [Streptomyces iranensis]|uniref:Aspartate ammonia-lyase n=1 Tax=Streptomyces iranensis TaxID=576784 RepID=A0A061A3X8_9ACTN|nr:aspartate ammonia-lyase [Streptomyces iranensis]MBP2064952.1 aspartate ammonia-lyase [Streptomyces iranensis]CDR10104.1 aspartate ammonia-lyase [Streptomyces iranensis]